MQVLGGELVSRLGDLRLNHPNLTQLNYPQPDSQQRFDTDAEIEADLAELDGDGPSDTVGLQVYSTGQHFANMQSLEQ